MSDEEIIKRRLLIDGDGTGDDRRLNMLLKQYLKWTFSKNDSPENNQIIYDRLLAQLAQCEFAAAKTEYTSKMIEQELKNYGKLAHSIENNIELAKQEIADTKKELVVAKEIRKNKMEYDMLAKKIKEQPDRKDTNKQIDVLKKELNDLVQKKIKLERKFQKRRNDFALLMYTVRELEALDDDTSSECSKSDADEILAMELTDDEEPSNATPIEFDKGMTETEESESTKNDQTSQDDFASKEPMSVEEDAVLELSIDKDESEVVKLDLGPLTT